MNTICLFKVTVKGFVGDQCKTVYVVSDSMDDAYRTYRSFLDEKDLGFESNRELKVSKRLCERSKLCQKK